MNAQNFIDVKDIITGVILIVIGWFSHKYFKPFPKIHIKVVTANHQINQLKGRSLFGWDEAKLVDGSDEYTVSHSVTITLENLSKTDALHPSLVISPCNFQFDMVKLQDVTIKAGERITLSGHYYHKIIGKDKPHYLHHPEFKDVEYVVNYKTEIFKLHSSLKNDKIKYNKFGFKSF